MQRKGKNKAVATGSESLRVDNRADLVQEPMQEMVVGDQSMEVVEKGVGDSHISCGGSTERPSSLSGLQENRGKAMGKIGQMLVVQDPSPEGPSSTSSPGQHKSSMEESSTASLLISLSSN